MEQPGSREYFGFVNAALKIDLHLNFHLISVLMTIFPPCRWIVFLKKKQERINPVGQKQQGSVPVEEN